MHVLRWVFFLVVGGQGGLALIVLASIIFFGANAGGVILISTPANVIVTAYVRWANGSQSPLVGFGRRVSGSLAAVVLYFLTWPGFLIVYIPLYGQVVWIREVRDLIRRREAERRARHHVR